MRKRTLAGYLFALGAGAVWGTTGPLSTALYAEGQQLAGIGFWRVLLGVAGLGLYGLFQPGFFRMDRRGLMLVMGLGGFLVAMFEVPYQFGIAGAGVAAAATLLYLAPMIVAVLANPILGERLTWVRTLLALVVMAGAYLTVTGSRHETFARPEGAPSLIAGVIGGLIAAFSYAGTTILARWAVPKYGTLRVLFYELLGGTAIIALLLAALGRFSLPPATAGGVLYTLALAAGPVLGANLLFFAAVKRIEAAPTSVAATIEPVVAAVLALLLFDQRLAAPGWLGLALVVGGVAASYAREQRKAILALAFTALLSPSCTPRQSDDGWTDSFVERRDELVPTGRNPYFILEPGYQLVLEDGDERLVITVLEETRVVDGTTTRIVEERETVGGALKEVSRNFFAISTRTGGVYYFGEEVDTYRNGAVTGHEGAWLAGANGARFGLMMPSLPLLGARFQQETAPGIAMDRARIVAFDDTLTTPAGRFTGVLRVEETTPLEPMARESKWYAPGVGLIRDGSLRLVRAGMAAPAPR